MLFHDAVGAMCDAELAAMGSVVAPRYVEFTYRNELYKLMLEDGRYVVQCLSRPSLMTRRHAVDVSREVYGSGFIDALADSQAAYYREYGV